MAFTYLERGKLKDHSIFTCEGDSEELTYQLTKLRPKLSANENERTVKIKTIELEKITRH